MVQPFGDALSAEKSEVCSFRNSGNKKKRLILMKNRTVSHIQAAIFVQHWLVDEDWLCNKMRFLF